MRVLLTATSLDPSYGGPAFSVSRLATALGDHGAEVGLWSADGSVATTPLLAPHAGVERLRGPPGAALQAFAPDVVHDNGLWLAHNHRIAALARDAATPRLVSTRGMLEPWAVRHKRWRKRAAWEVYQRLDLRRAAGLHATADAEAEHLEAWKLGPPIVTIPNGMDLPELEPDAAASPADGTRTALFIGRIYPVKGLPMLARAWAIARPAGWRLVIAGPDEAGHQREVEAAFATAGLGDVVSFPGSVDDAKKARLLRQAELFILPSHSESFGMAIAEALAHARPVLTTTAAPWPQLELLRCGWRAAAEAGALAEALRLATSLDPTTLRAMGAAGRALIAAEFGWARVADRFAGLYDRLATTTSRAAPRDVAA